MYLLGTTGENVKKIQKKLGVFPIDGQYGNKTMLAVKNFQKDKGLIADGIAGNNTLKAMGLLDRQPIVNKGGLPIEAYYMDNREYSNKKTKKEYIFLHHTAGWHNPYNVINDWNKDERGKIGTEYVIGGQSIKNNDNQYDGKVLQAFPDGYYAWHLGKNGSQYMHEHSVGIELCSFGQLKDGRTYVGGSVNANQIESLEKPYRGFTEFHRYSDKQLQSLRSLLLLIGERDNIDLKKGVINLLKNKSNKAFDYSPIAYQGIVKGLWFHSSIRNDKLDLYPQPSLIDMLLSL
jgi:N-acetyl-anhydromuramyl-L-alanine amidase AmpD